MLFIKYKDFNSYFITLIYFVCLHTCTWHRCRGQRATSRSWLFPSTMWALGFKLRSSSLAASTCSYPKSSKMEVSPIRFHSETLVCCSISKMIKARPTSWPLHPSDHIGHSFFNTYAVFSLQIYHMFLHLHSCTQNISSSQNTLFLSLCTGPHQKFHLFCKALHLGTPR